MSHTNHQIDLTDVTTVDDLQFQPLDPRFHKSLTIGISLLYILLMALALLLMFADEPWLWIAAEAVIAVCFIANLSIVSKAVAFRGYAIRQHDISYRRGIIFPKVTTIPFTRIQQISIKQNPISKHFHLRSLEIVNGAQAMSAITIPGLNEETATRMKDFLTDLLDVSNG